MTRDLGLLIGVIWMNWPVFARPFINFFRKRLTTVTKSTATIDILPFCNTHHIPLAHLLARLLLFGCEALTLVRLKASVQSQRKSPKPKEEIGILQSFPYTSDVAPVHMALILSLSVLFPPG